MMAHQYLSGGYPQKCDLRNQGEPKTLHSVRKLKQHEEPLA